MNPLPQEIFIDDYKFDNFRMEGRDTSTIFFDAARVDRNDVTNEDKEKIVNMLSELGKWEALVRTGFNLLSEMGIGPFERATLDGCEKKFGVELYEFRAVQWRRNPYCSTFEIHLKVDERHRREDRNIEPIFSTKEIYDQITNIPKWKAFEKTMKIIKEQWTNR